jgi:hypothetical protein
LIEMGAHKLLAQTGLETQTSWTVSPKYLWLQVWLTVPGTLFTVIQYSATILRLNNKAREIYTRNKKESKKSNFPYS